MQTGTFTKSEEITEATRYGSYTYTATLEIIIKEFVAKGRNYGLYQTERRYRNGQLLGGSQYPANTEYARERRSPVCNF